MKHIFSIIFVLSLGATAASAAELADSVVENTLGAKGVSHTTDTQTRYGHTYSDVSYKSQGKGLFVLRIGSPEQYAWWKQVAASDVSPVAAVGVDAFRMKSLKSVCAKSASTAVCVTPDYFDAKHLTPEQIVSLVKAAL